jgi:hypothetical protein
MFILHFNCVLGATHVLIIMVSRWSWCSSFLLLVLLVCWSSWLINDHDVHLFFLLVFLVQIMCWLSWLVGYHDVHPFFFWCYWCKSCVDRPSQLMIMMFIFSFIHFLGIDIMLIMLVNRWSWCSSSLLSVLLMQFVCWLSLS